MGQGRALSVDDEPVDPLLALVDAHDQGLNRINTRLLLLLAMEKALQGVCYEGRFTVTNSLAYRLVTDSYEMLVIDVASFCRSLCRRGGFLHRLSSHLNRLRLPGKQRIAELKRNNPFVADEAFENPEAHFRALFPAVVGRHPGQADLDALVTRVAESSRQAVELRNVRHAHRYESDDHRTSLPLPQVAAIVDTVSTILHAVRFLAFGNEPSPPSYDGYLDDTANDVADLIVQGSIENVLLRFYNRSLEERPWHEDARTAYYASETWTASQARHRPKTND